MDDINVRRKKLIFRSWHRGTREMDLLMGTFADRFIPELTNEELDLYEDILQESDPDLYNWISEREPLPARITNPLIKKLIGFQIK